MTDEQERRSILEVSRDDNLLVALRDLRAGEQIEWGDEVVAIAEDIPAKHKVAACDLSVGDSAFMYGRGPLNQSMKTRCPASAGRGQCVTQPGGGHLPEQPWESLGIAQAARGAI